jgi:hypothetical protein
MPHRHYIEITIDRRIIEHPDAVHVRRMRNAIWLYLMLLARLAPGTDTVAADHAELARSMGLPEGTIRSWLGHLRKGGYVELRSRNGAHNVRVKHVLLDDPTGSGPRRLTVAHLRKSLGDGGDDDALAAALATYPQSSIRAALMSALAVPASKVRRSRTALFLYLLKNDYAPTT